MKNIVQIFLILVSIHACTYHEKMIPTLISGTIPAMRDEWLYIEELEVRAIKLLDSLKINNDGIFEFELEITEPGFYVLRTDRENYALLFVEPGNRIIIDASSAFFSDGYDVKGSSDSDLLRDFELFMSKQKTRIDSLAEELNTNKGLENFYEKKKELDSVYLRIYDLQREYVINFIDSNLGSLVSLIVLNRKLGNTDILNEEEDFIYFHLLDSALMVNYPANKHAIDHHKRVQQIRANMFDRFVADKKLVPGKKAPNIILKDTSGRFISLKDLEGRKVLVYFWAGWNARSRQDNRKLISLFPNLRENHFEILGVSMDENEKIWKGAIRLDKTPWIQGSDLMGNGSKIIEDYNLRDGLPYYYIVDEERNIIYRHNNIDSVITKLDQIF